MPQWGCTKEIKRCLCCNVLYLSSEAYPAELGRLASPGRFPAHCALYQDACPQRMNVCVGHASTVGSSTQLLPDGVPVICSIWVREMK